MEQMRLFAFRDELFTQKHEKEKLTLDINPESLKFEKGIVYREDKQLGTTNGSNSFERYEPEKLSFSFTVDTTGVVEGTKDTDQAYIKIKEVEDILYAYNEEGHRPSYIVIAYGELLFKGQLASMKVDYTLFNNDGIPLRATVNLSFSGFRGSEEDKKKFSKLSPDMSRLIVIKENDTLANLCHLIYGNSRVVAQVARFNNLNGFRDVPVGTELLFPPLKKS